ncbi:hypothetical protein GEV33_008432 [Tenebrio molitor]|uniref:Galectin n=1 Tax=Tenebrio molitor TaxID=7067 RepID=A0A8J6H949_TENMO|nr:hypothetical protein GEV33_008432 [Tenebrio molitor]
MYCKAGQASEEEMYNNEEAGPAFVEFLETMGKKVRLKGFNKYKAGLDNKSDSTGLYSVYSQYQDCEIMFHVSTMLPFTPNNRQQLLRKRHIGNDIVTIVFQEPGALPFTPKGIRSQFQHVFIVVQAINPCTENTHYKVAVSRSKDVEVFGPPIKDGAIFPKGKAFAEFLLAKVVNAENAAHRSEKFVTMATRTRQEYLKELVTNNSTSTPVDTHQKFSIFSSKKKEKIRPRFIPDACQRGAILWQVWLDDSGQSQQIECFLGISTDTLVLIEENSKQIVFVTPCKSILGWSSQSNGLRIYHHQGECMTIYMRDAHGDRDELMEIMDRLKAVTQGVQAKELPLRRNIMGQLGFHVQPDGIVTLVESAGEAWHGGLRQNSRLVEICKVAVSTLTYDQMVDLLKTSILVTLTVIPPLPDGSPRKGCTLQNCKYNEGNYEGDYENLGTEDGKVRKAPQMQQAGNHRRIYERSFSPPRSSNSSGYGTGSSSKSFHGLAANPEGTMTSSSSGHSSDDKWYDVLQELEPPPVPQKTPSRSNNTFPSTPKRNNQLSQLQVSQSHNHFGPQPIHHNKVQISHSLPLQHVNYSQPLTAVVHNNTNDYEMAYKLEKNNVVKQQRQESDYMMARQLNSDYGRMNMNDSHSTDSSISERLYGLGSEDELSNGSGNVSPRSRRAKHLTTSNSRNHSPRSINGEAKLRPGVTARSSNRNSANLSSSNFQEELLRLINPDNIEASAEPKLPKETNGHSRENLNSTLSVHKTQPEVILTMARPATVISNASTTSSPLPSEFKGSKDELTSPTKTKSVVSLEEFPVPEDWPTLVDTATRVLMQVASEPYSKRDEGKIWDEETPIDASITSSVSSSTSVPELQNHVTDLESSLKRETRRRLSLENEVRRLKEENKKLKDQAQSAVQQLRKFTEWFFKNKAKEVKVAATNADVSTSSTAAAAVNLILETFVAATALPVDIYATVPFAADLPQDLNVGKAICVSGVVLPKCSRFAVNLTCGRSPTSDVAFHLNPRLLQRYVVRNSHLNGHWGEEEKTSGVSFPFRRDANFILTILIGEEEFLVAVDGVHVCTYRFRVAWAKVKGIDVQGAVDVLGVEYKPLQIYPELIPEREAVRIAVGRGHAADAEMVTPVTFLLPGGFQRDWQLEIYGRVKMLPHSFYVNLQEGAHRWPHPNIPLHLNPRFGDLAIGTGVHASPQQKNLVEYLDRLNGSGFSVRLIYESVREPDCVTFLSEMPSTVSRMGSGESLFVRNAWIDKGWGREERTPGFQFAPGSPFTMAIRRGNDHFSVWIDGKLAGEFKFRGTVDKIDTVHIEGDVVVFGVVLEEKPDALSPMILSNS